MSGGTFWLELRSCLQVRARVLEILSGLGLKLRAHPTALSLPRLSWAAGPEQEQVPRGGKGGGRRTGLGGLLHVVSQFDALANLGGHQAHALADLGGGQARGHTHAGDELNLGRHFGQRIHSVGIKQRALQYTANYANIFILLEGIVLHKILPSLDRPLDVIFDEEIAVLFYTHIVDGRPFCSLCSFSQEAVLADHELSAFRQASPQQHKLLRSTAGCVHTENHSAGVQKRLEFPNHRFLACLGGFEASCTTHVDPRPYGEGKSN
mmetsp:Transcript_26032/g.40963  ORF Transcript_26032/g.40963 Transcript_26032/m.40963 type:complete len:265 (+) Transcript_26032:194-988(+)